MDVNNNAWYFTGEIDYKKIPLIQKCKNIIVKCSVTTNFEVDNIISYLHNICSSGEMKTLDLREFYLPSGIYSIGYCSNIEKIILPQGESRISYCKNLKEIVLPQNSLLNITETNHNISLTKFVVEYGHKYYCVKNDALYSKDGRTLLLFPTNKICNYKLEESTEFIHENAFEGSLLKSISLNRNLKNIGKHAFKNSRIEKLYFNQSECELDEFVFEGCSRLHDIMIPAYWKTIKKGTFPSCLYEDKGYMAADKMAIDTTGYKEEASIKQIQIRNNALKYYNPICHEHELYEEILSDYISEQKENEYLLEKLFHYNTLVNYGKSYFSHDDLEKVRMDFMSFASHIL